MAAGDALSRILAALDAKGVTYKQRGNQWDAPCVAHDDKRVSFGFRETDGKVVIKCLAGCEAADIVQALGLTFSDLFDEEPERLEGKEILDTYNYTDEEGEVLYQVVRFVGKDFRQRRPDGAGGWVYNLKGVERVPYRLPVLLDGLEAGRFAIVTEGERDADNLAEQGFVATTNAGGAKSMWADKWFGSFKGAKVVLLPDNDNAGRKRVDDLAPRFAAVEAEVRIIELPVGEHGDVSDWLAAGGDAEQLKAIIKATPVWEPERKKPKSNLPVDVETERLIIGSSMVYPDLTAEVCSWLTAEDFSTPKYAATWYAFEQIYHTRGERPDPVLLATEAAKSGASIGVDELTEIRDNLRGPCGTRHVELLQQAHKARRVIVQCQDVLTRLTGPVPDPDEAANLLEDFLLKLDTRLQYEPAKTISEVRDSVSTATPEVISGMLNRRQRALLVAPEGLGKSSILRACAFSTSQGFNPFTHRKQGRPFNTMVVDAENDGETFLENLDRLESTLKHFAGQNYDERRFKVLQRPGGLDLRRRGDRAELQREIAKHRPELICMGPLYKMMRRKSGEHYEDVADEVLAILDDLRIKYDFGLLLEAHAPNAQGGNKRTMRPYGSMYLTAWPDFGLGLYPNDDNPESLDVVPFRGSRRKAHWPDRIDRDSQWLVAGFFEDGMDT